MIELQPHQIQQQVVGLGHCAGAILAVISGNYAEQDGADRVARNASHIETVCAYPHFAGKDMEPYLAIARQGRAWLGV